MLSPGIAVLRNRPRYSVCHDLEVHDFSDMWNIDATSLSRSSATSRPVLHSSMPLSLSTRLTTSPDTLSGIEKRQPISLCYFRRHGSAIILTTASTQPSRPGCLCDFSISSHGIEQVALRPLSHELPRSMFIIPTPRNLRDGSLIHA